MVTKKSPENEKNLFICECCNYKCCKNSEYIKHLLTRKHIGNASGNIKISESKHICAICKKIYKSRKGLWSHNKVCNIDIVEPVKSSIDNSVDNSDDNSLDNSDFEMKTLSNLVVELIKSNQELQKQVFEVCKTSSSNINSHNTINSNNKNFNLNFFLNEQCKDAMNIMDFVNTFQLSLSDFERIGEVGYVEGISTIVIDKLNQMDVYKRPIHCSDAKRETMHVKDNDVWIKDASANDKIRLALKHITKKNTDMIRPWLNAHPGVLNSEHRLNDKYQEMFIEAMGGRKNKNMKEGEDKIIKKICKMVLIDKNMQ